MSGKWRSRVQRALVVLQCLHCALAAINGTEDRVDAGAAPELAVTPATPWRRPRIEYDRDLVIELIEAADYPVEKHVLVTKDGYLLSLHRIPDPLQYPEPTEAAADSSHLLRFGPTKVFRGVVLLVPGLFGTAADFAVTGPENGLAFVLADAGYDVWIANVRGSRFSRKNVRLSVAQSEFWNFSFHEIGTVDVAAIIDYILSETNEPRVFYVGHNQGMTALFALLSAKPHYNRLLRHAVGLASVAYLGTTNNLVIRRAAALTDRLYATLRSLNISEITPSLDVARLLSASVCSGDMGELCAEMLRAVLGSTVDRLRTLLPAMVDDLLGGISTRQLIHFGQLMQTEKFQQFDHKNRRVNVQHYGQAMPPEYNLSRVLLPLSLFHGTRDFVTSTKDALKLRNELVNVQHFIEVPGMNHIDFVYSDKLYALVNRKIIDIFNAV